MKLSVQISKETKKIKSLIPEYNACQLVIGGESSMSLLLNEALDPSVLNTTLHPTSSLPSESQQELIDAKIMVKRSSEEISMLDIEMKNIIQYYVDRKNTLQEIIQSLSQREDAFRGTVALLQTVNIQVDNQINKCFKLFDCRWPGPFVTDHSESDSESDSDLDESDNDL